MDTTIGSIIKAARLERGETQVFCSQMLEVHAVTLAKYEAGTTLPSRRMVEKLARYYQLDARLLYRLRREQRIARVRELES